MGIVSYAQNFEDVLLHRVFGGQETGFYVDLGAYHPVMGSTTKAFYDRGWSGINVEPSSMFAEFLAARPRDVNLQMAVMDYAGEVAFVEDEADRGLSHVAVDETSGGVTRMVPCDTLEAILRAHSRRRPVDFLKVDVEGAEAAIVRSTNWRALRPRVLLMEATLPWSSTLSNQDWEPILLEQGYVRAYFDGINCFYVPDERSDLLRHFELPVNVLDGFTRPEPPAVSAYREELRAVQERMQVASTDLVRMNAENTALQEKNALLREQNSVYAGLVQACADTASELRQQYYAQVATLQADRDRLAAQHDERVAFLQADRDRLAAQLEEAGRRQAQLMAETARLHRSVRERRWLPGPGPALPLAGILRRRSGSRSSETPLMTGTSVPLASSAPDGNLAAPELAPLSQRSLARRLALLAYAPIRPFARPIAWRSRTFVTGELRSELGRLSDKLQLLLDRPAQPRADSSPACFPTAELSALQTEMRQFGKMLETTLLTLALERDAPDTEGK